MQQSSVIFGFLFVAFVIFITQRGELPTYLGFLLAKPVGGSTGNTATAANTALPTTSSGPSASDIANVAKTAFTIFGG